MLRSSPWAFMPQWKRASTNAIPHLVDHPRINVMSAKHPNTIRAEFDPTFNDDSIEGKNLARTWAPGDPREVVLVRDLATQHSPP